MDASIWPVVTGLALLVAGVCGLALAEHPLRKTLAFNIMSTAVFLLLIAAAQPRGERPGDPVPHAMVLTGIVVAVSATAVALALIRRLSAEADASSDT